MPGLYTKGHLDLAGFVVGMVETQDLLGPSRVQVGDQLIAFPSSGFHSNGFSLIRKWFNELSKQDQEHFRHLLLTPTRIYHQVPSLAKKFGKDLHGLAHITGGGITQNVERLMPEGLTSAINTKAIRTPEWMKEFIRKQGHDPLTFLEVFNLGVGMIAAVNPSIAENFILEAQQLDIDAYLLGSVTQDNLSTPRPQSIT